MNGGVHAPSGFGRQTPDDSKPHAVSPSPKSQYSPSPQVRPSSPPHSADAEPPHSSRDMIDAPSRRASHSLRYSSPSQPQTGSSVEGHAPCSRTRHVPRSPDAPHA